MARVLAACIVSLATMMATPTFGQTTVLSGEHADFTRLVFASDSTRTWSVERQDGVVVVTFDAGDLNLDSRRVFDLIPRTRLRDFRWTPSEIQLDLNCDCPVDVSQIPSGHMVIDISDGTATAAAEVTAPSPPALPLRLDQLGDIALRLELPPPPTEDVSRVGPLADLTLENVETLATDLPQIVLREQARHSLLPSDDAYKPSRRAPSCPLEDLAARLLQADPKVAFSGLAAGRAAIIRDTGEFDVPNARALATTYLEIGWGAEAIPLLRQIDEPVDSPMMIVAGALDNMPDLRNVPIDQDASCGPATTTLLLLTDPQSVDWDVVGEDDWLRFVDRLPPDRLAELRPKIATAMAAIGREPVLARLGRQRSEPMGYVPETDHAVAAGTDEGAVRKALALLRADGAELNTDIAHLTNALALLPSVPDGPLKTEFREELLRSLLLTGHLAEAIDILQSDPELAQDMLRLALSELSEEEVVETAIRLRPYLRSRTDEIDKVADIMMSFGLTSTAGDFRSIRTGEGLAAPVPARLPRAASPSVTDAMSDADRAWFTRSFSDLVDTDATVDPSPRQRVAGQILDRNARTEQDTTDFARAENSLSQSRELTAAVEALLADNSDDVVTTN